MSTHNKKRLIEAARSRFASLGYANTSMDELSASVGLTRGALYHQFGGKEGLLKAVVEQIDDEIAERLSEDVRAIGDPWQRQVAGCRGYLRFALEPEFQRIVLRDAPAVLGSGDRSMHSRCHVDMADGLESLMDDGVITRCDPHALTRLLCGSLANAALWIATGPEPEARLAQSLSALDAMLSGLIADRPLGVPGAGRPDNPA